MILCCLKALLARAAASSVEFCGSSVQGPGAGLLQPPNRSLTKGQSWWEQLPAESSFCDVGSDRDRQRRFPGPYPAS